MSYLSPEGGTAPVPSTDAATLTKTSPPPGSCSVASGSRSHGDHRLDFRGVLDALGYRPGEYVSVNHQPPGGEFRAVLVPVEEAVDQPARWPGENVWWSVNPVRGDVVPGCRGTVEQVTRWVALYVDIDVKTGGMPSWEAAYALIDELSAILGVRPVLVVRTGHGLQPLWLLEPADEDDRALDLTVLERRRAAVGLLARWGRLVGWVAGQHGGAVDTVFDLARVLRVADTVNVKFPDRPVPVTAVLDTGAPLTVGRLVEVLDEYAIPAYVEDAETIGQVVNDPEGWGWASAACVYTAGMIKGWENDPWPARHPKLVAATVRLACARRYGCLTEEEYRRAVKVLTLRMEQLCAHQEPVRKVARGEITGALAWGQAKAASLSDERVREELGDHEHRQPLPDWLPEPPTTKPQGCADPAPLPEPDLAQLWARPSLARLRDFARSRRVAPLALLGAALARAVAACPAQYVLPPLVGSEGTL